MEYGDKVWASVVYELAQRKKEGQRFSVTLDDWTSTRNRRYMNVNVHGKAATVWNLGLVRVHGSMPAEKCVELLEKKLSVFGLSLKDDIVAICTDGASVMTKVGKLITSEQQLCYAHSIQLAVIDVLYHKRVFPVTPAAVAETVSNDESDDDDDGDVEGGFKITCDRDEFNLIAELSILITFGLGLLTIYKRTVRHVTHVVDRFHVCRNACNARYYTDSIDFYSVTTVA
jgi:hypothetical protein